MTLHPLAPDLLYQQNHCGIYRMRRPEARWVRIGDNMPREVGDIGFAIALHPRDPNTAWVFPMDGTDVWPRTCPGGKPAVYRTRDGGESWSRLDRGFPERAWYTVLRQSMAVDAERTHRRLFRYDQRRGMGEHRRRRRAGVASPSHLPHVYSVEVAQLRRDSDESRHSIGACVVHGAAPARVDADGAHGRRSCCSISMRAIPGIRFRMVNEANALRPHMRVFVNRESIVDLDRALAPDDEVMVLHALSGG